MFKVQVRRVGNSLGVLLPGPMLHYLHLNEGDSLDVAVDAHRILLTPESDEKVSFQDALAEVLKEDRSILSDLSDR